MSLLFWVPLSAAAGSFDEGYPHLESLDLPNDVRARLSNLIDQSPRVAKLIELVAGSAEKGLVIAKCETALGEHPAAGAVRQIFMIFSYLHPDSVIDRTLFMHFAKLTYIAVVDRRKGRETRLAEIETILNAWEAELAEVGEPVLFHEHFGRRERITPLYEFAVRRWHEGWKAWTFEDFYGPGTRP